MFSLIGFFLLPQMMTRGYCPDLWQQQGDVQVQQSLLPDNGHCSVNLTPTGPSEDAMKYRAHFFSSDGSWMVFNSYGQGDPATMTGSRVFYLFPRTASLSFSLSASEVAIQTESPLQVEFSPDSGAITGVSDSSFLEAGDVNPSNAGGVELRGYPGTLLDCGFVLGHSPQEEPNRESVFTDSFGNTCKVLNREIFDYSSNGDVTFHFQSDPELGRFLGSRCPELEPLGSLH